MKFEAMFQPIQIGPMTVANRFVMSPMGNNFANTDGTMSERSASYYGARAKGGFGLITFEATVVYKEAKGGPRKPCLYDDSTVSSFQAAIAACHQAGAKVSIQLQHAGPEGNTKITGYPLKAASAIPASCGRETPEAITKEELYRLIECYGDAAVRAKKAGADAVEIHCAHGYLVSTFISARTNKRVDEFGGSFENRMRLPKLIIENIRKKAGDSLAILCRINATDDVEGGQTAQDAAAVASYLEKECGVDGLHLSRAVHLHDECMWAPSLIHGGFSADYVTEIKRAVSVPIITVGRYTEPQFAELMVAEGRANLVAFGRQSIADPEMPNKAKAGRLDLMNPCIGCLQGCVPNMFKGEPITCLVNPLAGREADFKPAQTKKNVMVIGGGPGGLTAAYYLTLMGHKVTVYEQRPKLGGMLRYGIPDYRLPQEVLDRDIDYILSAGIAVHTGVSIGKDLTMADIQRSFDAVYIAIGAHNDKKLGLEGETSKNVVSAVELLRGIGEGKAPDFTGKKVCVVGGGVGCAIAYPVLKKFHDCGAEVHAVIGFKNKDLVILEDEFRAASSVLKVCTDDGSYGQKGVVTEALKELIDAGNQYDEVFAIGPMVMMKFVSKTTEPYGIPTTVSMSPIMIDGTGMCGGCRLSVGGEMKFACVDGPDFDGHKVDWDLAVKRNQMYRDFEAHKYEETCNLFNKEAE